MAIDLNCIWQIDMYTIWINTGSRRAETIARTNMPRINIQIYLLFFTVKWSLVELHQKHRRLVFGIAISHGNFIERLWNIHSSLDIDLFLRKWILTVCDLFSKWAKQYTIESHKQNSFVSIFEEYDKYYRKMQTSQIVFLESEKRFTKCRCILKLVGARWHTTSKILKMRIEQSYDRIKCWSWSELIIIKTVKKNIYKTKPKRNHKHKVQAHKNKIVLILTVLCCAYMRDAEMVISRGYEIVDFFMSLAHIKYPTCRGEETKARMAI